MKKTASTVLIMLIISTAIAGCSAQKNTALEIALQIDRPMMTVNGSEKEIDPGRGTVPILQNDRVLLPVRAIVEEMGGAAVWDQETQTVVLAKDNNIILLLIGGTTAYLNQEKKELDTPPVIIDQRTMLPIRFIAESFGFAVAWDGEASAITITNSQEGKGR